MNPPDAELWVIDPSCRRPETQGIQEIVTRWGGPSRTFQPVLIPGDGPKPGDPYPVAGVVVLGSAASVHDEPQWIEELGRWIDPILQGQVKVPLLGICFGHQLIAQRAGARVGFLAETKAKRLGVEETEFDGSRIVKGQARLRVVVSHRETVVEVPDGFLRTASRPGVEFDGIEHESRPIFSYQFHPEAREEFAAATGIPESEIDDRLRSDSGRLLDGFLDVVRRPQL